MHDYKMVVNASGAVELVNVRRDGHSRVRRGLSVKRYIETMVVTDESMYEFYGRNEIELRRYILSVMAIVSISFLFFLPCITNRQPLFISIVFWNNQQVDWPHFPGIAVYWPVSLLHHLVLKSKRRKLDRIRGLNEYPVHRYHMFGRTPE